MNNVLVISDNSDLVLFMREKIFTQHNHEVFSHVDYKYSALNKFPNALISLGMGRINLKDPLVIDQVIETYDIVISIHCKQIFPEKLVKSLRCINVHPGYNPYNRGWYPQVFSIINGLPIGATIHLMDAQIDHGEIIDQCEVEVLSTDISSDVYVKIIEAEKRLIEKNIKNILDGAYTSKVPAEEGNYNSNYDFKRLCELDLNHYGSFREHIDLLRALTFDGYNNAFFYDSGKKIYVNIAFKKSFNL